MGEKPETLYRRGSRVLEHDLIDAINDLEDFSERQLERNPRMRVVIATVLSALPAGWQPIETAPRNRPVLLTAPGGQIGVCVWGGRWLYHGIPMMHVDWWDAPTHWHPLPAPPDMLAAAGGEP